MLETLSRITEMPRHATRSSPFQPQFCHSVANRVHSPTFGAFILISAGSPASSTHPTQQTEVAPYNPSIRPHPSISGCRLLAPSSAKTRTRPPSSATLDLLRQERLSRSHISWPDTFYAPTTTSEEHTFAISSIVTSECQSLSV
jgi:hypothetical protein